METPSKYQTIAEILDVIDTPGGKQVQITIPGWDPSVTVSFPFEKLPAELQHKVNVLILVKCALDAETYGDLGLEIIGLAPEPINEKDL